MNTSINEYVERHPWTTLLGAVAVGVGVAVLLGDRQPTGPARPSAGFDSGVDTPADRAVAAGVAY